MRMTVGELTEACGGRLLRGSPETAVTSVTTDSRQVEEGALFVPVIGDIVDAHRFIGKAFKAGAAAVLTQEALPDGWEKGAVVGVSDTRAALQKAAAMWRGRFRGTVVGVTGSVGKTTTKEMIALSLSSGLRVMKTQGNQNSQIGLPLTMFHLSSEYDAAVVEMGMSQFGEMGRLASVAAPDFAVMTNIGVSHIGNLKTQENIRTEKLHITDRFHPGSVLFLNGDDPMLAELCGKLPFETVSYGTRPWCLFRAESIRLGTRSSEFQFVSCSGKKGTVRLPVPGKHCVLDALAGLAMAERLGVPLSKAAAALAEYRSPAMRMQIRETGGVTVIDDSYNSSPDAARSSIAVLCGFRTGRRIAVLADMLELGGASRQEHFQLGEYAARSGVDLLVTVGEEARAVAEGALSVHPGMICRVCSGNHEATAALRSFLAPGDTVLVKGSRGMKTDEIVEELLQNQQN